MYLEEIIENTRKNIDAYPQRALFEGVINAVTNASRLFLGWYTDFVIIRHTRFPRLQSIWESVTQAI